MRKPIVIIVYFILMIVLMVGCMPPTFMPPAKVNVDLGDNITDVSIAVDQNGIKHIVGIKDNQVVFSRVTSVNRHTNLQSVGESLRLE